MRSTLVKNIQFVGIVRHLLFYALSMFKVAIYFSIVIFAWTSYGTQAKSLDSDLSTIPKDPANQLMVKMLPLLDHIARQSKCNVFDDLDTTLEVKQSKMKIEREYFFKT